MRGAAGLQVGGRRLPVGAYMRAPNAPGRVVGEGAAQHGLESVPNPEIGTCQWPSSTGHVMTWDRRGRGAAHDAGGDEGADAAQPLLGGEHRIDIERGPAQEGETPGQRGGGPSERDPPPDVGSPPAPHSTVRLLRRASTQVGGLSSRVTSAVGLVEALCVRGCCGCRRAAVGRRSAWPPSRPLGQRPATRHPPVAPALPAAAARGSHTAS